MQDQELIGTQGVSGDAIVDAALAIIVRHGLSGLTLRPLALSLDVSVAVISARMGAKEQLIERVVEMAAHRDQRFFERWVRLASRVELADHIGRATLSDLAFREWITSGRHQAIFLIELVHDRALQDFPSPALDRWLASAGAFWSTLVFGSAALADLALGYVLDEAGFALGAGDEPAYGLLRTLCLQRFAAGVLADARRPDSATAISRLIAALEPGDLPVGATEDPKRQRIADCAGQIIVLQGMEAVTHRSVALAADVPASTVVYLFGARATLLVAGLHAVIARFHAMRDTMRATERPADDTETRDLVKATSMIALASMREPSLLPYAIDMRRRRGENIRTCDLTTLGFRSDAGFDRTAAQVISVALFGMRMVAMARKLPERAHYQRAFAAVEAWSAIPRP